MTSKTSSATDVIFLTGLTVDCIVGIWDWERRVKQKIVLDLEMAADVRRAAASDSIDDTLDYKRVAKRLLGFVGESQYQLVETLAERVGRADRHGIRRAVGAGAAEQAGGDPRCARRRHPDRAQARGLRGDRAR